MGRLRRISLRRKREFEESIPKKKPGHPREIGAVSLVLKRTLELPQLRRRVNFEKKKKKESYCLKDVSLFLVVRAYWRGTFSLHVNFHP